MPVSGSVNIEQIDSVSFLGSVRDFIASSSNTGQVRDSSFLSSVQITMSHLPHLSMPIAKGGAYGGWGTEDEEDWSDSPTKRPEMLYRHRFGWGRDRAETFSTGYTPDIILSPGDPGKRWGNLDDNSGLLMYERDFPVSATGSIRQIRVSNLGSIQNSLFHSSESMGMTHIGEVSSEYLLTTFPFVLLYAPKPFSIKNPVDTDIYLRISNYAHTIASGTIAMSINGVYEEPLQVTEFFGGLGGYDVTWNNSYSFPYDSTVVVKVEFLDTDSPANKVIIDYPFYIVKDLAPPRIINIIPQDGTTGVTPLGTIQFEIVDYETGVDISTLRLYVNNILIVEGVHGNITNSLREDGIGYVVSYTAFEPWLYGDIIPVAVFVKDTSPSKNELFYSYSFKVLESTSPRIINISPAACDEGVSTGVDISIDIVDGGHGIDKSSVSVSVNDIERSDDDSVVTPIVHRDE